MKPLQALAARRVRVAIVTVLAATIVAACGPSTGVLGPVATPPPSSDPSVVQSPDPTPPPSSTGSPGASASVAPSSAPSGPASTPGASVGPSGTPTGTTVVRAYFNLADGLVPVLRSVPETKAVARAALNALLAGPSSSDGSGVATAIPDGVTLLGISIAGDTATVDLSPGFSAGGSTASQVARVAQVVYTLTQFGNVDHVLIEVGGAPLAVPDDTGATHSDPVGRADYRGRLPQIFVDRPAWRAAIGNPARVTGSTDVFEATFRVRLTDGAGRTLVDQQVMATCGSGCWGTFDVTLRYTVATAQWGTLRVYNPSAKDGTPEDVRDEPVWLTPSA